MTAEAPGHEKACRGSVQKRDGARITYGERCKSSAFWMRHSQCPDEDLETVGDSSSSRPRHLRCGLTPRAKIRQAIPGLGKLHHMKMAVF